jgi:hypothetical protein
MGMGMNPLECDGAARYVFEALPAFNLPCLSMLVNDYTLHTLGDCARSVCNDATSLPSSVETLDTCIDSNARKLGLLHPRCPTGSLVVVVSETRFPPGCTLDVIRQQTYW